MAISWRGLLPRRATNQTPVQYVNPSLSGILTGEGGADLAHRERILRTAMGQVGTLTAVLDGITSSVAAIRWHLYRTAPSGLDADRVEVTGHPALAVLNRPNPAMSWQDLVSLWVLHYELVGEAFGVLTRLGRIPVEIWPTRPDRMIPVPGAEAFLDRWDYRGPSGSLQGLPVEDVLWWRAPNPWDPYHGIGVLQSVLIETETAAYSAEWNRNFFLNSATPGGVIQYDRVLSDHEWATQQKRWRASHKGVRNAHRVATIEGGGQWVNASYSMRDMQFAELRRFTSEAIREAFRYPLPLLGTTTDVNRATATAAVGIRQSEITLPILECIRGVLNRGFLSQYAGAERLEFDFDNPVTEDEEVANARLATQSTAAKTLIDAGFDAAEVLDTVGLPAMTWRPKPAPVPVGGGAVPVPGDASPTSTMGPLRASRGCKRGQTNTAPHHHSHTTRPQAQRKLPEPPDGIPGVLSEDPDLDAVQDAWLDRLDQLLTDWDDVLDAQYDALIRQVRDAVDSGDVTALTSMSTPTGQALETLTTAMIDMSDTAAVHVADEADDQDVTIDPVPAEETWITDHAHVVTALMGTALAIAAARVALTRMQAGDTGAEAAQAVREHLDSLTDAQPKLSLGSALTAAQNEARIATLTAAEQGDGPIPAYYASEVLDANTCAECRWIDKKWLGNSIADVRAMYPGGGYRDCEGGPRCRGTVVVVWRKGADTTKWKEKEPL